MNAERGVTRRSFLQGAAGAAATLALGSRAATALADAAGQPLWKAGWSEGVLYGTACAMWQFDGNQAYADLVAREAAVLWTQDDLLWYQVKPSPTAPVDFSAPQTFLDYAAGNGQLVIGGPGLVWDDGFGDGWTDNDLWGLSKADAQRLLYGTNDALVRHFRGRFAAWVVVNEVIDAYTRNGLRTDFLWLNTIGPEVIAESFHQVHELDPGALLVLNDFGYETGNQWGDKARDKQLATLKVLDRLLAQGVPVQAFGIQAHIQSAFFLHTWNPAGYRRFLAELADRGLKVLITELDVSDGGFPSDIAARDRGVAEVYKRYLDTALDGTEVQVVLNFGLTDPLSYPEEAYPRHDGLPRRPLPFDAHLRPKPAYYAIRRALRHAHPRTPLWTPPRAR